MFVLYFFVVLHLELHGLKPNIKIFDSMKRVHILLGVLFLLCSCANHSHRKESSDVESVKEYSLLDSLDMRDYQCVEGKVKKNQFFSSLMNSLGLADKEAYNLAQACDTIFDVRKLRVGNRYKAYYSAEGDTLKYLVYDRDRTSCVIFDCQLPYRVILYEKPITVENRYVDISINNSLWVDMREAGAAPELILSLSDIYAWTIDFFGLQKGDRFKVIYDERLCDGEVVAVDTVRYAVFTHGKEELPTIMFNTKEGGNVYWNEKGESMRKTFLKAPLQFSRISSGFSYARKHPITRKVQPHTGVDYAAPKGTPVMTIGDGVVVSKKYEGAGGNVVRIKHNSVYSTAYLHLSGYANGLKVGQRVKQGEVIGYVGSTGRSTGPHLDFRVWKNGTPINPLTMDSPPAEPLKEEYMEAFNALHEKYKARVDSLDALAK